jgi:hypothetical protein
VDLSVGVLELEAADQERQRMTTGATIDLMLTQEF